jgi:hypothetical protein
VTNPKFFEGRELFQMLQMSDPVGRQVQSFEGHLGGSRGTEIRPSETPTP